MEMMMWDGWDVVIVMIVGDEDDENVVLMWLGG